jgi:hypothetical protein
VANPLLGFSRPRSVRIGIEDTKKLEVARELDDGSFDQPTEARLSVEHIIGARDSRLARFSLKIISRLH